MAGTALATRWLAPDARVIAAEPAGADDAWRSFTSGGCRAVQTGPNTIADGLLTSLGERNFAVMMACVDDVLTVSDPGIVEAMRLIWTAMKIIVEPSAAVPLAAMLEHPDAFAGRRVGMILSGGNVDLDRLPWAQA